MTTDNITVAVLAIIGAIAGMPVLKPLIPKVTALFSKVTAGAAEADPTEEDMFHAAQTVHRYGIAHSFPHDQCGQIETGIMGMIFAHDHKEHTK